MEFSGARRNGLEMGNLGLEPYLGVFTPLRTGRGPSCSSSKGHANWLFPIWTSTGFLEMNLRQKARMLLSFLVLLDAWQFSPQKPQSCLYWLPKTPGLNSLEIRKTNLHRGPLPVIFRRSITPFIYSDRLGAPEPMYKPSVFGPFKRRFLMVTIRTCQWLFCLKTTTPKCTVNPCPY